MPAASSMTDVIRMQASAASSPTLEPIMTPRLAPLSQPPPDRGQYRGGTDYPGRQCEHDLCSRHKGRSGARDPMPSTSRPWRTGSCHAEGSESARKNTQLTRTTSIAYTWRKPCGHSAIRRESPSALDDQKGAVKQAPDDETPARAMPQPAQEEDDHQIQVDAPGRARDCRPAGCTDSRGTSWTARCASAARIR